MRQQARSLETQVSNDELPTITRFTHSGADRNALPYILTVRLSDKRVT